MWSDQDHSNPDLYRITGYCSIMDEGMTNSILVIMRCWKKENKKGLSNDGALNQCFFLFVFCFCFFKQKILIFFLYLLKNICCCTHKKCLREALIMTTHNIGFCGEN